MKRAAIVEALSVLSGVAGLAALVGGCALPPAALVFGTNDRNLVGRVGLRGATPPHH